MLSLFLHKCEIFQHAWMYISSMVEPDHGAFSMKVPASNCGISTTAEEPIKLQHLIYILMNDTFNVKI